MYLVGAVGPSPRYCRGDRFQASDGLATALDYENVSALLEVNESWPAAFRLPFSYHSDFHKVSAFRASSRSKSICSCIQYRSEFLNLRARRMAVSALMPRLPRTISLIRRGGTPISRARAFWLSPMGSRNSSKRILPG